MFFKDMIIEEKRRGGTKEERRGEERKKKRARERKRGQRKGCKHI